MQLTFLVEGATCHLSFHLCPFWPLNFHVMPFLSVLQWKAVLIQNPPIYMHGLTDREFRKSTPWTGGLVNEILVPSNVESNFIAQGSHFYWRQTEWLQIHCAHSEPGKACQALVLFKPFSEKAHSQGFIPSGSCAPCAAESLQCFSHCTLSVFHITLCGSIKCPQFEPLERTQTPFLLLLRNDYSLCSESMS